MTFKISKETEIEAIVNCSDLCTTDKSCIVASINEIGSELNVVETRVNSMESVFSSKGYNISQLGVEPNTGVTVSQALYEALLYCKENDLEPFIPSGTYIVSPILIGETSDKCVRIPSNLTLYIEKGAEFKLEPGSPIGTKVLVPESNVKIFGSLKIDGSANTIVSGNEYMSGLFLAGVENFYAENLEVYNCYGDNVYITSNGSILCKNIQIDNLYCEKAGRKNLDLEGATEVYIKNAILDNTEGNSASWNGGGCLDCESYNVASDVVLRNKIDYLETTGTNDFTAGEEETKSDQYRLDIGTLVQKAGGILSYAMTISIDYANFLEDFTGIDLLYGSDVFIKKINYVNPKNGLLKAQFATRGQPRVKINDVFVEGNPITTPSEPLISWKGSSIHIDRLRVDNYNQNVIASQYTHFGEFHIDEFISNNSGGDSVIYLDYDEAQNSFSIDHFIVRDTRETPSNKILDYSDENSMKNCKINQLHNPNSLPICSSHLEDFIPYFKLSGLDDDVSIVMSKVNPEGNFFLPKGSIVVRTDGNTTTPSLYIKETSKGVNTGWLPLLVARKGTTAQRPTEVYSGLQYYDTTLGKPIWSDGTNWKDSSGEIV